MSAELEEMVKAVCEKWHELQRAFSDCPCNLAVTVGAVFFVFVFYMFWRSASCALKHEKCKPEVLACQQQCCCASMPCCNNLVVAYDKLCELHAQAIDTLRAVQLNCNATIQDVVNPQSTDDEET